jgi:hypothetical protein
MEYALSMQEWFKLGRDFIACWAFWLVRSGAALREYEYVLFNDIAIVKFV